MALTIKQTTITKVTEWVMAFLLFLMSTPVFIWNTPQVINYIYILFFILSIKHLFITEKRSLGQILVFISYIYIIIRFILVLKGSFLGGMFLVLSIIPFLFLNPKKANDIFEKYVLIFAITILPSVIQYIFVMILGVNFPYHEIASSPWNPRDFNFLRFYFFVQEPLVRMEFFIPRFHGYYDEPGVVGTIAIVLLYINKFNLKKWTNLIIFIAGILSFSFFFFLSSILYFLLFTNNKVRLRIIASLMFLFFLTFNIEMFQFYFYDKLILFSDSGIDMRMNDSFSILYNSLDLIDYLFGVPLGIEVPFSTLYKFLIVIIGVIPLIMFLISIVIYYRQKVYDSKDRLICFLIPVLVLAQRPFLNNGFYVFLILISVLILSYRQKIRNEIN